jgi:hypothetical protein
MKQASQATKETTVTQPSAPERPLPWWRIPAMWFVIGGPALVVVAGIATAVIAVRGGDVPLPTGARAEAATMSPAKQARNHAATARP